MAMGITQALKLQEGPINALAQLPQQQLMAMAQQGRIAADILPIILNEKAEMAQAAANMQAMAKPMPASVTERNMAINAQAEAPQAQPQMMAMAPQQEMPPMDAGVASLPLPEDAYSMAGGGIADLRSQADMVRRANRSGDSILAHINPREAEMLGRTQGSSINPITGLPEYGFFDSIGNFFNLGT